eukprot:2841455-Prymnesium_polylepis.1
MARGRANRATPVGRPRSGLVDPAWHSRHPHRRLPARIQPRGTMDIQLPEKAFRREQPHYPLCAARDDAHDALLRPRPGQGRRVQHAIPSVCRDGVGKRAAAVTA